MQPREYPAIVTGSGSFTRLWQPASVLDSQLMVNIASESFRVAGHQPVPGIIEHFGANNAGDQPASSPMRSTCHTPRPHVLELAQTARGRGAI